MDVFYKEYHEDFLYICNNLCCKNFMRFGGVGNDLKPLTNYTDEEYLFNGVQKKDIYQKIQEFRSLDYSSIWNLIKLAGLCRSIIVSLSNWIKTTQMVDISNLPQYITEQFKDINFFVSRTNKLKDSDFLALLKPELTKINIIYCSPLKWNELISFIKKHYPETIFHSFDIADCLYILYTLIRDPEFYDRYISNYEKDLLTYVECLAGAIKSFMTYIGFYKYYYNNDIQYHKENKSLCEIIFLQFLDCFLQDQKCQEVNYFLKIIDPKEEEPKKKTE